MADQELFDEARKEFLSHLRYTKGHSTATCYSYHSDLGIWAAWLAEAGKDWQRARASDVEQFAAWQLREKGAGVHIVARRLSALSSFYKWAAKHEIVAGDPVALADKPKRPHRIPVWLEKDEQQRLEATVKRTDDLPDNIFGQKREHVTAVRRCYELLFTLLLNSGLRISEALGLKVADVRLQDGAAKSVRVIGKGNRERIVPLPEAFGRSSPAPSVTAASPGLSQNCTTTSPRTATRSSHGPSSRARVQVKSTTPSARRRGGGRASSPPLTPSRYWEVGRSARRRVVRGHDRRQHAHDPLAPTHR